MAKANEKVMSFVESELERHPGVEVKDLYEKAKGKFPSIGELDLRQFNARYPLQVKKRKAGAKPSGRSRRRASGNRRKASDKNREAVRATFLSFATELTAAEDRHALVKVLAGVDSYVDQAIKASTRR